MNAGAAGSNSDVLLFLHADTRLPADADRLIGAAVEAGAAWGRFDVQIDSSQPLLGLVSRLTNLRSRLSGIATGDQAIFVRRDVFEQVGGFPDIPLMEDVALSARLKRFGPPACLAPAVVTSARRWEQHGSLRTILLMWRLRAMYFLGAAPQVLADLYGYARRPRPARAAVAILAKAPIPGLAKTRLAATIGPKAAARVQRSFTLYTLCVARQAALGPVRLWCAPDASHVFFRALARLGDVERLSQGGGDLGARLRQAMDHHFGRDPQVPLLIIGTDCPLLAPGHLQQAAQALAHHDAVVIPATDGGYVLIGMRRPLPDVFAGVAWSTPQVLQQTQERLRAAGATWCELAPLWDVDEASDWQRYQQLLATSTAPATQEQA